MRCPISILSVCLAASLAASVRALPAYSTEPAPAAAAAAYPMEPPVPAAVDNYAEDESPFSTPASSDYQEAPVTKRLTPPKPVKPTVAAYQPGPAAEADSSYPMVPVAEMPAAVSAPGYSQTPTPKRSSVSRQALLVPTAKPVNLAMPRATSRSRQPQPIVVVVKEACDCESTPTVTPASQRTFSRPRSADYHPTKFSSQAKPSRSAYGSATHSPRPAASKPSSTAAQPCDDESTAVDSAATYGAQDASEIDFSASPTYHRNSGSSNNMRDRPASRGRRSDVRSGPRSQRQRTPSRRSNNAAHGHSRGSRRDNNDKSGSRDRSRRSSSPHSSLFSSMRHKISPFSHLMGAASVSDSDQLDATSSSSSEPTREAAASIDGQTYIDLDSMDDLPEQDTSDASQSDPATDDIQ